MYELIAPGEFCGNSDVSCDDCSFKKCEDHAKTTNPYAFSYNEVGSKCRMCYVQDVYDRSLEFNGTGGVYKKTNRGRIIHHVWFCI